MQTNKFFKFSAYVVSTTFYDLYYVLFLHGLS